MNKTEIEKLLANYTTNKALLSNLKLSLLDCESDIQIESINHSIAGLEREILLLENGLATLTPEEYEVLDLKYFKREKGHVIADKLGLSKCGVYVRINNAKARLQKVIK